MGLEALLPGIGGLLGGLGGASAPSGPKIVSNFQKVLSHGDWWDSTLETDTTNNEITCTTGQWTKIGRYQVKPRQRATFGFGNPNQPDNQGYLYLAIYDDTATNSVLEEGKVRFVLLGYDDMPRYVVAEHTHRSLRGDANDKAKKIAMPLQAQYGWVREDGYLVMEFNPDATDDVIKTAIGTAAGLDIWDIPTTIQTLG